ncbi:MAG: DUF2332 domain-containing protein [Candidatus Dormibacteria bacterium]
MSLQDPIPDLLAAIEAARARGDDRGAIVAELEFQAAGCDALGSPLYGELLRRAAEDAGNGGPAWEILRGHSADPPLTALALRLMAAVHRRVLTGGAPELARHYASAHGTMGPEGAGDAFLSVLRANVDELSRGVGRPCQTNEPGRAAGLVGGFLTVARESGLPPRVLEVGASAGLNLRWDHFRYQQDELSWGPPGSPVHLAGVFESPPPFDVSAVVVDRRGCDPNPQDPTLDETRLNLRSSAWPDQVERFHTLEGALEIARAVPAAVDRAEGALWVAEQLARPRPGVATVVYHSIVLQYMGQAGRARFEEVFAAAGARATNDAPLARLAFEPGDGQRAHVHLTTWPGGERRLVATSGYHGRPVRWLSV